MLKGTDTEVELVVLHHDAATGAAVSLVRFPAGLTRTVLGCYPAAEELAIIDGSLDFAGALRVPGDYTVRPAARRAHTDDEPGRAARARVVLGRSRVADRRGRTCAGRGPRSRLAVGELRRASRDVPGRTDVLDRARVAQVDRDVLDIDGGRWCFVPADTAAPECDGPVQVRTWP